MQKNKLLVLIVILIAIVGILFILYIGMLSRGTQAPDLNSTPSPANTVQMKAQMVQASSVKRIPTILPGKGFGLDLESQIVKDSEAQIEKLKTFLPYKKTVQTEPFEVVLYIPTLELNTHRWMLSVDIVGPEYEVGKESASYDVNKESFLKGVNELYSFLQSHDVDPSSLFITWGGRAYIQEQAEEWLGK